MKKVFMFNCTKFLSAENTMLFNLICDKITEFIGKETQKADRYKIIVTVEKCKRG
jgi:hypothetical protein